MSGTTSDSMTAMIADTAERLFSGLASEAFDAIPKHPGDGDLPWDATMWQAVEELGFPLALLEEDAGGFGLDPLAALGLVRQAAAHALPLPLGETMLANLVLAEAGLALAQGPAALVGRVEIRRDAGGWRLCGSASDVPWGRSLETVVVCDASGRIARVTGGWQVDEGRNLAGEPRDTLHFDLSVDDSDSADTGFSPDLINGMGALIRAQAIAGALEGVLKRSIAYVNERVQFGRPLAKFQAIQHNIAIMATNTAAARAGADMAAAALPHVLTDPARFLRQVAAAKLRAGEAASLCAPIAHQVHGAIGVTREYALHPLTTRLWAWRDEHGSETDWADHLGSEALLRRHTGYWPYLTGAEGDQT